MQAGVYLESFDTAVPAGSESFTANEIIDVSHSHRVTSRVLQTAGASFKEGALTYVLRTGNVSVKQGLRRLQRNWFLSHRRSRGL